VGVVCLVGWTARLGFLANLLSRPVLTGYLTGMAALMVVSQLGKLTGLDLDGDGVVGELRAFAARIGDAHLPTTVLAAVVLVALFAFRHWAPRWPGPLLIMVAAAGLTALLGLGEGGIALVGEVPKGLPEMRVPRMGDLELLTLFPYALGLAVVGYSDNVVESRAFAARRHQTVDSGQELLALGAANVGSSLLQGFPVSSSGSRTALGDMMGSRSQLFSLVSLACVLATLLFLGPVLAAFPSAALGAVVVYAAYGLVDMPEWRRIARFRRSELVLGLTTAISVLLFGVLTGIGIAVVLSLLDLIRRMAHPHDSILGYVPGFAGMHDIDDYPEAMQISGLLVYRYDSPLFFANAEDFTNRALAAVDSADQPVQWFVLNAESNVEVDLTAVDTLEMLRQVLIGRDVVFAMARVKQDLRDRLRDAGFVDVVGDELIFPTLPSAAAAYVAWYEGRNGVRPPGLPDNLPPPIVGGHPKEP
ncbi:MAG: SulP family inorganic anion transporter, partial [Actinomycetota bacterium]